jgi:hypothetical protein
MLLYLRVEHDSTFGIWNAALRHLDSQTQAAHWRDEIAERQLRMWFSRC